ncbi:hypothetical protein [Weissella paramesenteroides]|uniref:hypothetical protein n=1 Tax=Weissella paramesenteroides TaxID=1249 RepID=UPI00223C25A0|nr:hypothetical protein [Weissella paramesenteroides]MCT0485823.1 hypothetical protein [Weissella paramesenteroides]
MTRSTKWFYGICGGLSTLAILFGSIMAYTGASHKQAQVHQETQLKKTQAQVATSKFERQRPLYSQTEKKLDTFMSAFFNYDNQQGYDHRRQSTKKVVSQSVYDDKKLFKDDKYKKTKQLGLQSTFVKNQIVPTKINDSQLEATVYTTQKLNYEDEKGKDTVKVFKITYDGQTDKLSKIKQQGVFEMAIDSTISFD